MKRVMLLVLLFAFIMTNSGYAEIRTREITPICRTKILIGGDTNQTIWTPGTNGDEFKHIVCDSWTISSNANATVTLSASSTIVALYTTASQPVVSPGGFLFRGSANETIRGTLDTGSTSLITLTGYEEK